MLILLAVSLVAFFAAAVNAVAGGGTFFAFPTLTGVAGLSEKIANISCTIGLWPGTASSVLAARGHFSSIPARMVALYTVLCLVGGALGAELLIHTSAEAFRYAIPFLLGFATLIFALAPRVQRLANREEHSRHSRAWTILVGAVQFVVAIYGGYFGAGLGVLTLAGLSFAGIGDLRRVNTLKVLLSGCTNLTAAVIFLFCSPPWRLVLPMIAASAVGGFVGMRVAQRLPLKVLRGVILTVGTLLTAVYFYKTFAR